MTNTTHTPKTNFFNTKEDYIKFITFWKALATSKNATQQDHIVYTILKGNDFKKAFSPITNKTKLRCSYGNNPYHTLARGVHNISWAFRFGTVKDINIRYTSLSIDWLSVLNDDTKTRLMEFLKDKKFSQITGIE